MQWLGRALILCVAGTIPVAALTAFPFRSAEGIWSGSFLLALALAGIIALIGCTVRTTWQRAGLWLALALIGQYSALQLIDAGPLLHFQHYRLPPEILASAPLKMALLVFLVQAVFVIAGLTTRAQAMLEWIRRNGGLLRAGFIIAACCCVSAALSRQPKSFLFEICFASLIEMVNLANILLFAWVAPESFGPKIEIICQKLSNVWNERRSASRFLLYAAAWVTLVSALLAFFVYQKHPHIPDEVAYLYNARYFAAGLVAMKPPPVLRAFEIDLMGFLPGKWYAAMPGGGWPALLSLGLKGNVPWLINPLLAGLNLVLGFLFLREFYSRRTALISLLLLACSPWYVFLSMSYMNHNLTLTFALGAFLALLKTKRTGGTGWAWIAGLFIGAGTLVRPLDGVIVAIFAGSWALMRQRLKLKALAAMAIGTIAAASLVMPYNKALTGHYTVSGFETYFSEHYGPKANTYGFGPDRGIHWPIDPYPGHSPMDATVNAELNLFSVNVELFGWSTGSLLLLLLLLFYGKPKGPDLFMISAIAFVILAYSGYWYGGGPDFGARYWYLIIIPCAVLSSRGLEWLQSKLSAEGINPARAALAVAALCALALLTYFPWRCADKYHHYLKMQPDVIDLARQYGFGRSLVLVQGEQFPDYASAAIYNPLDLYSANPVYVWDASPEVRAEVLEKFSDRKVWIVEGPSRTQAGFRVASGPLTRSDFDKPAQ